jgi:outer membrane protein
MKNNITMKHVKALLCGLLLQTGFLHAQSAGKLSLKQCIEYSLQNHPSQRVYNNEVEVAKSKGTEAVSSYLPQLNGTGTLDDNVKRQVTIIPAGAFSPVDIRVQFGVQYMTNLYAQVDQTIYDQSMINSIKANKPNMEIARLQKQKNNDQLIYNTASAYYQAMIQQERVKLLAENEAELQEIMSIQQRQYEKGVIKKIDYDRVKVNYNNTVSQKQVSEMSFQLALNQLKNAMGMPLDQPVMIADSLDYASIIIKENTVDTDIRNTWDYKIQTQNIRLQEVDYQRKKASVLPTLSAYGRYGAQALNNNFADQYNNWFDYSVIGLKLNVPVFSGLRRYSQIRQSELNLYSARENFKVTTSNLQLAVLNSNTALSSSYRTFLSNKENLDLAKNVFDNTSLQYQRGVAPLSDLLNSEFSYKEAQSNYINSLVNYLLSRMDLERSKGTLSQYLNQL